jgi:hypothetical protein
MPPPQHVQSADGPGIVKLGEANGSVSTGGEGLSPATRRPQDQLLTQHDQIGHWFYRNLSLRPGSSSKALDEPTAQALESQPSVANSPIPDDQSAESEKIRNFHRQVIALQQQKRQRSSIAHREPVEPTGSSIPGAQHSDVRPQRPLQEQLGQGPPAEAFTYRNSRNEPSQLQPNTSVSTVTPARLHIPTPPDPEGFHKQLLAMEEASRQRILSVRREFDKNSVDSSESRSPPGVQIGSPIKRAIQEPLSQMQQKQGFAYGNPPNNNGVAGQDCSLASTAIQTPLEISVKPKRYQEQLLALEKVNRKRFLMTRQEQAKIYANNGQNPSVGGRPNTGSPERPMQEGLTQLTNAQTFSYGSGPGQMCLPSTTDGALKRKLKDGEGDTSVPASRRRIQNRLAQADFRQRQMQILLQADQCKLSCL